MMARYEKCHPTFAFCFKRLDGSVAVIVFMDANKFILKVRQ